MKIEGRRKSKNIEDRRTSKLKQMTKFLDEITGAADKRREPARKRYKEQVEASKRTGAGNQASKGNFEGVKYSKDQIKRLGKTKLSSKGKKK